MANPEVYYGKPYDFDPDFHGPKKQRSSTDVGCLYVFLGYILLWFSIGIYALVKGNPQIYIDNFNISTITCTRDKPNLLYLEFSKCENASVLGCDSPSVCLSICPNAPFVFTNKSDDYLKVYCVNNTNPTNNADAANLIKHNLCSLYYFPSKSMDNVCIPTEYNFTDIYEVPQVKNLDITYDVIDDAVKKLKTIIGFDEISSEVLEDFKHGWPIILGSIGIATVATIVYIIMMRWIAGFMVWASLLFLASLLIICVCALIYVYVNFDHLYPNMEPDDRDGQRAGTMIMAVCLSIVLIVFVIVFVAMRKKIRIAIMLIKESSKAIGDILSSLFFPVIPYLVQIGLFIFGLSICLFLTTIGEKYYTLQNFNESTCHCTEFAANYTNGGECRPDIFKANCSGACDDATCSFAGLKQNPIIYIFHGVNAVAVYWVLMFFSGFMELVLAGAFATWYWTFPKNQMENWTVSKSFGRTVRYHLGTIAFGSLVLTIVRIIRTLLEGLQQKLRRSENGIAAAMLSCCQCLFNILEGFLKFISRNAYIVCAVHGTDFCSSTKEATSLVMRNLVRVVVYDKVTDFLIFLSKFLITLGMGCVSYSMLKCMAYDYHNIWIPVVIMIITSYLIVTVFFNVFSMAVNTLFICYLEDIERNDGSPDRPFYMSNSLKMIYEKSE